MSEHLQFATRSDFRDWLSEHCTSSDGVWLLFGKAGGPKTLSANDALEEALCYGWIDGQMQSLDAKSYIKYFSMRRENSKWSDKNKAKHPINTEMHTSFYGAREFAITDVDGYVLTFTEHKNG